MARSPLEGPDEPGVGLAPCPQLRPNQGWHRREAPRVGTRLMWSQGESSLFALAPHYQQCGGPGAWAQVLLSQGGGLSLLGLRVLVRDLTQGWHVLGFGRAVRKQRNSLAWLPGSAGCSLPGSILRGPCPPSSHSQLSKDFLFSEPQFPYL